MNKKVIYVDFKAASKMPKHTDTHNTKESFSIPKKKSFTEKVFEKFKKLFSIFRKDKTLNNDLSRHKHWL
jgi:hypothetical protein